MVRQLKQLAAKLGERVERVLYPEKSKKKNSKLLFWAIFLPLIIIIVLLVWYLKVSNVQVLNPKGIIGVKERGLMNLTLLLSVVVMVPVFSIATFVAWKYNDNNKRVKKYSPNWDRNLLAETVWWGIPIVLIGILATVTWISTHRLDPYKPLASHNKTMNIEVVALDWKWLFIYPEQGVATVNFVQIPVDTPINFHLTADAPMNSFWIPQLGGQIYAMPGMVTHLNLMADHTGDFNGSSANISGAGFAGMKFVARSSSRSDFDTWINGVKNTNRPTQHLDRASYTELAKSSKNNPVSYYSSVDSSVYDYVVMKYMIPMSNLKQSPNTESSHETINTMEMGKE